MSTPGTVPISQVAADNGVLLRISKVGQGGGTELVYRAPQQ